MTDIRPQRDDIEKVLITEEEIREKVAELGAQITKDYKGKNLLMVSVLKGSVIFMADLMRANRSALHNRFYVRVQLWSRHYLQRRGQDHQGSGYRSP